MTGRGSAKEAARSALEYDFPKSAIAAGEQINLLDDRSRFATAKPSAPLY